MYVERWTGIEQKQTDLKLLGMFGERVIQEWQNLQGILEELLPPPDMEPAPHDLRTPQSEQLFHDQDQYGHEYDEDYDHQFDEDDLYNQGYGNDPHLADRNYRQEDEPQPESDEDAEWGGDNFGAPNKAHAPINQPYREPSDNEWGQSESNNFHSQGPNSQVQMIMFMIHI